RVTSTLQSNDPATSLPFGWTLPPEFIERHKQGELDGRRIATWLRDLGVGWTKFPVWFEPDDDASVDAAAMLAMRLQEAQIRPVGMLDKPPKSRMHVYELRDQSDVTITDAMRDASIWQSELESNMNRLTIRIPRWQIGADRDFSLTGRAGLSQWVQETTAGLQGYGQPIDVAIPWPWLEPLPVMSGESWKAISRRTPLELTNDELKAMLRQESPDAIAATWLSIDPLPDSKYDLASRVIDLVGRMATTRSASVGVTMIANPMAPHGDMLTPSGRPGRLLLPWRTTSLLLGQATEIGSLRLQHQSHNVLYQSPERSVWMVWADSPRTETLFLGDDVVEVDVWGQRRMLNPETIDGRLVHQVQVDVIPKFLVGIDVSLAKFRMSVECSPERIDSILGASQRVDVTFANPINQPLNGRLRFQPPSSWWVSPESQNWELMGRQQRRIGFDVTLANNATIGEYDIPLDFKFETVPATQIRVYRPLAIGPAGFEFSVRTRMVGTTGQVKIEMANRTDQAANFDCLLFSGPDRQYERRTLVLAAGEVIQRMIELPDASGLVGRQMLLRAVERNGNRVINHTFDMTR
ncbi:MAG: hypothetical protein AAF745_19125, partial [Planctomycetota bacterium]